MDLRQLEMFRAVYETLSITRAAERIYVSPAAISLQMKALREELRSELFVRTGKQLLPTQAAHYLAQRCGELFGVLSEISAYFEDAHGGDRRPFVLGTGLSMLLYSMQRPIRALPRAFPQNEIRVFVDSTEPILKALRERTCDLGIVSLPVAENGLRVTPLCEEEFVLVRPADAKPQKTRFTPEEVARLNLILYPKTSNMRVRIDEFLAQIGVTPRVIMETDNAEAIKSLVGSGFGSSFLPESATHGRSTRCRIARVVNHRLMRTIALAMPASEHSRQLTTKVAEFLRARIEK